MLRCLVRKSFEDAVCSHQLLVEILWDSFHFILFQCVGYLLASKKCPPSFYEQFSELCWL